MDGVGPLVGPAIATMPPTDPLGPPRGAAGTAAPRPSQQSNFTLSLLFSPPTVLLPPPLIFLLFHTRACVCVCFPCIFLCPSFRAQTCFGEWLASMPSWTAAERDALRRAVSVHGHAWDAIVSSGACPGRDSRSLRWAWGALCEGGLVAESGTAAVPSLHPLVSGPVAPVESLPEELFTRPHAAYILAGRGTTLRPVVVSVRLQGSQQACNGPVCTTGACTMPGGMAC